MSELDPRALRAAFGSFLTGVTVVSARDGRGAPVGFTANSFTSVSLDPPLLLVCPGRSLSSFPVFEACRHFAVSVLAEDQRRVSEVFAAAKGDRFAQVAWRDDARGCPLIDGAAAGFSCRAEQRIDAGDHRILVGRIEAFAHAGRPGLGYSGGGYFSLGLERRAEALSRRDPHLIVGAVIEHDGRLLVQPVHGGHRLPQVRASGRAGAFEAIARLFADPSAAVTLGPVFSIFDDTDTGDTYTFYRGTAAHAAPGPLGRFVPLEDVASLDLGSAAIRTMLLRYVRERERGDFGLYLGDQVRGNVH